MKRQLQLVPYSRGAYRCRNMAPQPRTRLPGGTITARCSDCGTHGDIVTRSFGQCRVKERDDRIITLGPGSIRRCTKSLVLIGRSPKYRLDAIKRMIESVFYPGQEIGLQDDTNRRGTSTDCRASRPGSWIRFFSPFFAQFTLRQAPIQFPIE